MNKDYQALYNRKRTQYNNAKEEIKSLKEKIKELKSSTPVIGGHSSLERIRDRLNTIRQTTPDEIIDNDDHINKVLREEKSENKSFSDRSHEWFVKVAEVMWKNAKQTKSSYKWQSFTTAMAHGPYSTTEYTDNMKEKINDWYENNKYLVKEKD